MQSVEILEEPNQRPGDHRVGIRREIAHQFEQRDQRPLARQCEAAAVVQESKLIVGRQDGKDGGSVRESLP